MPCKAKAEKSFGRLRQRCTIQEGFQTDLCRCTPLQNQPNHNTMINYLLFFIFIFIFFIAVYRRMTKYRNTIFCQNREALINITLSHRIIHKIYHQQSMLGVVLVKHLLSNGGVHCGRSNISNVGYLYNNVGVDSV